MPRRVIADKHWFRQRCEIITDYFFRQRFRGEQMSSPSESQCRGYAIPPPHHLVDFHSTQIV